MIEKTNVKLCEFSWIGSAYKNSTAVVRHFYEPESTLELIQIGKLLYSSCSDFLVIGHTSNLYFAPDAIIENIISTRKLNHYTLNEDSIECECGVHVMKLAKAMNNEGIAGYEGLIDLPGTVGAAIYGNSDAYGYSINNQLISFDLLCRDGIVHRKTIEDVNPDIRTTDFKKKKSEGIIIRALLKKEVGDSKRLNELSNIFHEEKLKLIPHAAHNLGTVFIRGGAPTSLSKLLTTILYPFCYILSALSGKRVRVSEYINKFTFLLLGAANLNDYLMGGMSVFVWKDDKAHKMFHKYVKIHRLLFTENEFEIEFVGFNNSFL